MKTVALANLFWTLGLLYDVSSMTEDYHHKNQHHTHCL